MRVELTNDWKRQSLAQAVPGAYWDRDGDPKIWAVDEPDPRSAAVILKLFPEQAHAHPELIGLRDELYKDARPFDNATPAGLTVSDWLREELPLQPYTFQDLDLGYVHAQLEKLGAAYIGWERGLGKTLGAALIVLRQQAQRTLVVCPNTAKVSVWGDELARFLPDHRVVILPNLKKKREAALVEVEEHNGAPLVLVVHYEAMAVIAGTEKYKTAGGRKRTRVGTGWDRLGTWDLMVWDEAHRLSNTDTIQHKAAAKIPALRRLALSGSILQNHPEEMFGVLHLLFPKVYKRKWADWNDRYIEYIHDGYGKQAIGFKVERLDELRKELGVFMVYRRKEDELDLPKRVEQQVYVDLGASQRATYNDLLNNFWAQLDSGELLKAANPLSQLNLLRRVATGLSEDGTEQTDSTKLDWTVEHILDNQDEAFVVFSWYKAPVYALAQRLRAKGVDTHVVTGDTKAVDRTAAIAAFQDGGARVFLGTLSTLGESVNLFRANNAIFLDRSWNPATNAQAADRIYRIGQQRAVTITHLVARDTVDELRVQPTLAGKEALRRAVFGGA